MWLVYHHHHRKLWTGQSWSHKIVRGMAVAAHLSVNLWFLSHAQQLVFSSHILESLIEHFPEK